MQGFDGRSKRSGKFVVQLLMDGKGCGRGYCCPIPHNRLEGRRNGGDHHRGPGSLPEAARYAPRSQNRFPAPMDGGGRGEKGPVPFQSASRIAQFEIGRLIY